MFSAIGRCPKCRPWFDRDLAGAFQARHATRIGAAGSTFGERFGFGGLEAVEISPKSEAVPLIVVQLRVLAARLWRGPRLDGYLTLLQLGRHQPAFGRNLAASGRHRVELGETRQSSGGLCPKVGPKR